MALIIIFLLGIGNFALNRAVVDSRHSRKSQMMREARWVTSTFGQRILLGIEFLVLLVALLMVAQGWILFVWGYLAYSLLNLVAGWLILTRRI